MAGDINGDGRPDIVYGSGATANGELHPLLAQADGSYSPGVDIILPVGFGPACKLGDVNGDSKLDLICPSYASTKPAIAVLLGNGDGTFQSPILTSLGQTGQPAVLAIADSGDVNMDGHLDLVIADAANAFLLPLLGDGKGHFTSAATISVGGSPALVTLEDLNGDGRLDLVESGVVPGVTVLTGTGDGTFNETATYPLYTGAVLGDVDGDGARSVGHRHLPRWHHEYRVGDAECIRGGYVCNDISSCWRPLSYRFLPGKRSLPRIDVSAIF